MGYILFSGIRKACPEGQHYHYGGMTCHDINKPHKAGTKANEWHRKHGLVTTEGGESEKPKEKSEESEKEKDDDKTKDTTSSVPQHIDYPEIKSNTRASEISTAEAEWIFEQDGGKSDFDALLSENSETIEYIRKKMDKMPEDSTAKDYFRLLEESSELGFKCEDVSGNLGRAINGNSTYIYADFNDMEPAVAKQCVEAFLKAKEHMFLKNKVRLGAVKASSYCGVCWSERNGTSTVRLNPKSMNEGYTFNPEEYSWNPCYNVKGSYRDSTPVHELTHAYINELVYSLIQKGLDNGEIDSSEFWSDDEMTRYCSTITHGDIPKTGRYGRKDVFRDETCSKNYVYAGRFTQQVLQDAKKVAKAIYGMDSDTFRTQQTAYGVTKSKEGIPEAVADYVINGENATLANKLIYHSLQRYARFIHSDVKDIEPIQTYIKDLKDKQKQKSKKKKSVKKSRDYITFAELIG